MQLFTNSVKPGVMKETRFIHSKLRLKTFHLRNLNGIYRCFKFRFLDGVPMHEYILETLYERFIIIVYVCLYSHNSSVRFEIMHTTCRKCKNWRKR